MHKTTFTNKELSGTYIGYTAEGITPCFEIAEAIKIVQAHNQVDPQQIYYSEANDAFWQTDLQQQKMHIWKGKNYKTAEGIKHLYNLNGLKLEELKC